jgi:hypothetical protein
LAVEVKHSNATAIEEFLKIQGFKFHTVIDGDNDSGSGDVIFVKDADAKVAT